MSNITVHPPECPCQKPHPHGFGIGKNGRPSIFPGASAPTTEAVAVLVMARAVGR